MATEAELRYLITVQDRDLRELRRQVRELNSELGKSDGPDNFGKKLEVAGGKMQAFGRNATKFITLPLAAAAGVSLKLASDVDKGLREVNTLFGATGRESEKQFSSMQRDLAAWSREMGISQRVGVKGLYQAISAGVPKENVFEFMRVAGKTAIAGNTDVETSIDGLTTMINAFGLEASDAQAVADSMFAAVKDGKTTFDELSKAAFNVAPAAAAAGVSFQEVNAAISTLTASGTPTSVATTQIRAALTGLQKPSEDLDKIFQALGYQNAQVAIESEGLGFALDAVKKASKGNNGELQRLLGSTEAVAAANVLAGTGADKFDRSMQNQRRSAGSVDQAFAEMEKSTARQMERLKVGLENLGISIGNILLPWLNKLVAAGQRVSDWLNGMSDGQRRVVVGVGLFTAVLGPALIVTGKFVSALGLAVQNLKLVAAAKKVAAGAQAAYNAVMNANPIARVITALSLLAAGLVVVYQQSETFRAIVHAAMAAVGAAVAWLGSVFGNVWADVKAGTASLWTEIQRVGTWIMGILTSVGKTASWLWNHAIKPAWAAVTTATTALWTQVIQRYFNLWIAIFQTVGNTATWLWNNAIKPAWDSIGAGTNALWTGVIQPVAGFIGTAWRTLGDIGDTLASGARAAFDRIGNGFRTMWTSVIQPTANFIGTAWDKIGDGAGLMKDAIKTAFDFIEDKIVSPAKAAFKAIANTFIDVVNAIGSGAQKIGEWISKIPMVEVSINFQKMDRLANGDIVRGPQVALIGEDGPEAVIPLSRKRRKRGIELMTRAAQAMGVAGIDPSAGVPAYANGGIVGASIGDIEAQIRREAQGRNVWSAAGSSIVDFFKGGLGKFMNLMPPRITLPHGEWAQLMSGFPGYLYDQAKAAGSRLFSSSEDALGIQKIMRAHKASKFVMGRPYVWGGGRPPSWMHRGYDCSGYASTAWWEASGGYGGSGTTMSLFPASKPAPGSLPFLFGFRGMHSNDPRQQHMGAKILGDWFQFGDPGRMGGGDSQWTDLRVPPGVPGYRNGTAYVPNDGPAMLHRGERVIPSDGALVNIENVTVREVTDIDLIAGRISQHLALGTR